MYPGLTRDIDWEAVIAEIEGFEIDRVAIETIPDHKRECFVTRATVDARVAVSKYREHK